MPAKAERTKVEIKESSIGDLRTFNITFAVPISEFELTDLLKRRGIIGGLELELKRSLKSATEDYFKAAESLISGLVPKPSIPRTAVSTMNGNGRRVRSLSEAASTPGNRES